MFFYSFFSSTVFYLLWKIEENFSTLRTQIHPQFLADFQNLGLSSIDRMRQSLAVRIALYHLLEKLHLPIFPLSKNQEGKPILEDTSLHIGFAHTRYLAAVALSNAFPIGIDIEMVKSNLYIVQERFLSAEEVTSAGNCLKKLAIYWSVKEALYKRLNREEISTYKDIFIEPFQLETKGEILAYVHHTKYVMAYHQIIDPALPLHVLVYTQN